MNMKAAAGATAVMGVEFVFIRPVTDY